MGRHLASLVPLKVRKGYDILNPSNWTIYPRMVVLCAKDGGCEHGVTICGGLLLTAPIKQHSPLPKRIWIGAVSTVTSVSIVVMILKNQMKRRKNLSWYLWRNRFSMKLSTQYHLDPMSPPRPPCA